MRVITLTPLIALILIFGCSQPEQRAVQSPLVGAWRSKVQFKDGPFAAVKDLEFLYCFNQGGTLTESSNYDGAPPVPPAYGAWKGTSANAFEARYIFYTTKAPTKFEEISKGGGWSPGGRGELTEKITVAADGKGFESSITLEMFDETGKPAGPGGTATGHGQRVELGPADSPQDH